MEVLTALFPALDKEGPGVVGPGTEIKSTLALANTFTPFPTQNKASVVFLESLWLYE
ncbi:hypothetical protein [Pontibacter cellulosilyticus]|uniref:Uncharacterized protein n=1 Tax=Pontibacter cellulosilyticus TaxID=1720253 RepID=A0A923N5T2_9BACT|nr:hypothetical protein [Pontibacter cellulosilyticus]MBC5993435.1 hypothetical protein [Pontibacter cellulosilyticus]